MSLAAGVYVAGVGMTPFGLVRERSVKMLVREAVSKCLEDAGASVEQVQAAIYANVGQGVMEGQTGTPGQIALRPVGFETIPIINVENACASGATALYLAAVHILAGLADIVLAVGVEKLSGDDPSRRDALFAGGMDVHDRSATLERIANLAAGFEAPAGEGERSLFMDVYSWWARAHMRDFGTTQRQLAAIAAKNHRHSVNNPYCQFRRDFTVDEVLAARPLSYPLTVPMCSAYSDGAAAALLCSSKGAQRLGSSRHAVPIRAVELCSGSERQDADWDRHIVRLAADRAYDRAGIGPDEIDLAEVHDATAFGELLNVENLRLAARGEAGAAAERGEFSLGGRIPVNVSGGLVSRGHPLAATGLAQVHEIVTQLRGRAGLRQVPGAHNGILENGGGLYGVEDAVAVVAIFGAPRIDKAAGRGGRATPTPRRARRHRVSGGYARGDRTRHRIIAAAIAAFGNLGYECASTRLIARRAAVSLPALQYYFGGKDGLHRACVDHVCADLWARVRPAAVLLRNPDLSRAQLLHLLRSIQDSLLEWTVAKRPASWSSFLVSEAPAAALPGLLQRIDEPLIELFAEIISRILCLAPDHPNVQIRALAVLGRLELLRRARSSALRAIGWHDFRGQRLKMLKTVVWNHTQSTFPNLADCPLGP